MLAGVRDEDIAKDYAYTTEGLACVREGILQYLMKDKASMDGGGRERAENMLSSRWVLLADGCGSTGGLI